MACRQWRHEASARCVRIRTAALNDAMALAPARAAAIHGADLLHQGFTTDQVVYEYGDLCQSVTELAVATSDFRAAIACPKVSQTPKTRKARIAAGLVVIGWETKIRTGELILCFASAFRFRFFAYPTFLPLLPRRCSGTFWDRAGRETFGHMT